MVRIDGVDNFCGDICSLGKFDECQVSRDVVAEHQLELAVVGNETEGGVVGKDGNPAAGGLGVVSHPCCVGNVPVGQAESDVIRLRVRCDSVNVAARVQVDVFAVRPETASLDHALVSESAIGWPGEVFKCRVGEVAHPVVYPLQRIACHVANGGVFLAPAADGVQPVVGVVRAPGGFGVPADRCCRNPFGLGGEAEPVRCRLENVAVQALAVPGLVERCSRVEVRGVALCFFAQRVCVQHCVVERHVGCRFVPAAIKFGGFQDAVEFLARDFVPLDGKVVGELDRHFGAFVAFRAGHVRAQFCRIPAGVDPDEPFFLVLFDGHGVVCVGIRQNEVAAGDKRERACEQGYAGFAVGFHGIL